MNRTGESKIIPLLVLCGPTAVGKSSLAMELSQIIGTDIISADSAQVYKYMDIGTAKPSLQDQELIQHHLIDLIDPDQDFSVADYQKEAYKTIETVYSEGKIPFLVGGTGLYIKAVKDHYAFGQQGADPTVRNYYLEVAENKGLDYLYSKLEYIDPAAAKIIHPNDKRRIIRALEVYDLEGKPISQQVNKTKQHKSCYNTLTFALKMDREILYSRIDERVDIMLQKGFEEEVRMLMARGFDNSSPGMRILGYRQLLSYLSGEISFKNAVNEIKKQTRNFAKRQLTWFRSDESITWLNVGESDSCDVLSEKIYKKVKDLLLPQANK